jgi:hypothetical protein
VRKIVKLDPEVKGLSKEAVSVATKATVSDTLAVDALTLCLITTVALL